MIGMKVRKVVGYPFKGTVIGLCMKTDGKLMATVQIEPGPNAAGLIYIHPVSVLEPDDGYDRTREAPRDLT